MTAAESLVAWAWGLRAADVPPAVRATVRRQVVDGAACALGALRRDAVPAAVTVARRAVAPAEATLLGSGERLAAGAAALGGGALVHALDFDDTHPEALVHPTSVLLPALLAAGERAGSSGDDLLVAFAVADEIMVRLGAAVPHGFHARGFHATSVCGTLAAAVGAARLWRLSAAQAVDALGVAGSLAGGSLEFLATGSATKQLHPGLAAQAGLLAADLAAAGASGPASIIEGTHGLYALFTDQRVETATLLDGLGQRWRTPGIAPKPWPVCQLSHASLDAVAALLPLAVGEVEAIRVAVPRSSLPIVVEPRAAKDLPRTAYEAKFSLPWCVALLAVDGALTVDSVAQLDRPDVAAVARRVAVEVVETDDPPATVAGRAAVRLRAGGDREATVPPALAMPDAALVAKAAATAGGAAVAAWAEAVLADAGLPAARDLARDLAALGAGVPA